MVCKMGANNTGRGDARIVQLWQGQECLQYNLRSFGEANPNRPIIHKESIILQFPSLIKKKDEDPEGWGVKKEERMSLHTRRPHSLCRDGAGLLLLHSG